MTGSQTSGYGVVVAIPKAALDELILALQLSGRIPRTIDVFRTETVLGNVVEVQAHVTLDFETDIRPDKIRILGKARSGSKLHATMLGQTLTYTVKGVRLDVEVVRDLSSPGEVKFALKVEDVELDSDVPAVDSSYVDLARDELDKFLAPYLEDVLPVVALGANAPRASCAEPVPPAPYDVSLDMVEGELRLCCSMPGDPAPGNIAKSLAWNDRATVLSSNRFLLGRVVRGALEDWMCSQGRPIATQVWHAHHPCFSLTPLVQKVQHDKKEYDVVVTSMIADVVGDQLRVTATASMSPELGFHANATVAVSVRIVAAYGKLTLEPVGLPEVSVEAWAEAWVYILGGLTVGPLIAFLKLAIDEKVKLAHTLVLDAIGTKLKDYLDGAQPNLPFGVTPLAAELDDLRVNVSLVRQGDFLVAAEGRILVGDGEALDMDFTGGHLTVLGAPGTDLGWSLSGAPFGLAAGAGAKFAFSEVPYWNLTPVEMSKMHGWIGTLPVASIPAAPNSLTLAVMTDEDRYAKCRVFRIGGSLLVEFITFVGHEPAFDLRGGWEVVAEELVSQGTEFCPIEPTNPHLWSSTSTAKPVLGSKTPGTTGMPTATFEVWRVSQLGTFKAHTLNMDGALTFEWFLDGQPLQSGPLVVGGSTLTVTVGAGLCTILTPMGAAFAGQLEARVSGSAGVWNARKALDVRGTRKKGGCPPPRVNMQNLRDLEIIIFEIINGRDPLGGPRGPITIGGPDPVPFTDFAALVSSKLSKV